MAYKYPKLSGLIVRNPQGAVMKSKTMALIINLLYTDAVLLVGAAGKHGQQIEQDWKPVFPITGELDEVTQISSPHCHKIVQDVN